jgi:hypothetical protein
MIRQAVLASVRRHEATHYPRALMRLAEGQKLSFGPGTYLGLRGRDLMLHSQAGQELVLFPPGTEIWRNLQGQPYILRLTGSGEPRVLNR